MVLLRYRLHAQAVLQHALVAMPWLAGCILVAFVLTNRFLCGCHAGYLFFKGVQGANEEAERQDRLDGYID